jgi:hypothetical protein
MRPAILTLAIASSALGLSACTQPTATTAAPAAQTGSMQTAPTEGGVTFRTGNAPGEVAPPPVTAYTGSQRGSNAPASVGVTYPTNSVNAPGVGAYTGSQRGYSNSPLGFQRNPSGASTPVEQQPVTPTQ